MQIKSATSNIRELLYWSYANLAMADYAVTKNLEKYDRTCFMIRARLFKGLSNNTMHMKSLFDDEKIKLNAGAKCSYCGATDSLSLDHILPRHYGGEDSGDNLVLACKTCNSSKGDKDMLQWMKSHGKPIPLMVLRRYLKLVYNYCDKNELLDKKVNDIKDLKLPFDVEQLPINAEKLERYVSMFM